MQAHESSGKYAVTDEQIQLLFCTKCLYKARYFKLRACVNLTAFNSNTMSDGYPVSTTPHVKTTRIFFLSYLRANRW